MISDRQKLIYNAYQHAARTSKNKPFKERKNFNNLDDTNKLLLQKIESFFNANRNVSYADFFKAPYIIYNEQEYFGLDFFVTRKAIKCYTEYVKKRETDNPDSEEVLNTCKQCCIFIYNYCKSNNLNLNTYCHLINGTTPVVLQHLRDHKINFYVLCGLNVEKILQSIEPEIVNFIVDDFYQLLNQTKNKFIKSNKLKTVVRKSLQLIENKLLQ